MMVEENHEKTSFIIKYGIFCYKVMYFRSKNIGATYQHLVNKLLKNQIEHRIEVYMDSMLVKFSSIEHKHDLE